jgi:hypothetical protein
MHGAPPPFLLPRSYLVEVDVSKLWVLGVSVSISVRVR